MHIVRIVLIALSVVFCVPAARGNELLPASVIELAATAGTVLPGDALRLSGCIPAYPQAVDVYLEIITPSKVLYTLSTRGAAVTGKHPFVTDVQPASRVCRLLAAFTIGHALEQGEWILRLVTWPAGAIPARADYLDYDEITVTVAR